MFGDSKMMNKVQADSLSVQKRVERLAKGNLEIETIDVTDESIRKLADGINNVADKLNGYIEEISRVLSHLSVGDLTVEISKSTVFYGDFEPIKNALNKISLSLLHSFQEINGIMNEINDYSMESTNITKQVATNEERLVTSMNEVIEKTDEVERRTKIAADKVGEMFENVNKADQESQNGKEYITQMIEVMKEVNTASSNISGITSLIDAISGQTKMLALNASIEAARAGEFGRGFAVVADQIGNLALRTTNAVKETNDLINESINKVQESERVIGLAVESFNHIDDAINEIKVQGKGIEEAIEQQEESVNDIVEIIKEVSYTIENNAKLAMDSAESMQRLGASTKHLERILEGYTTDVSKVEFLDKDQIAKTVKEFFESAIHKLKQASEGKVNEILAEAIKPFPTIECVYLIEEDGRQMSETILHDQIVLSDKNQFSPAKPGADCSNKKYYIKALKNPNEIYSSYEYVSSATNNLCSTHSLLYNAQNDRKYILCVDMMS